MLSKLLQIDALTHVNSSSRRAYYKWIRDRVDGLQQRAICAKAYVGPLVTPRDGVGETAARTNGSLPRQVHVV
jgi:hypothetical protein